MCIRDSFKFLAIDQTDLRNKKNTNPNQVLTCAKKDWHMGASRFISICMGILQQMDKAIDKVDRDPVGLVWKTDENLSSTLSKYDMNVKFFASNKTLQVVRDRAVTKMQLKEEKIFTSSCATSERFIRSRTVSYTHLTLPTILLV